MKKLIPMFFLVLLGALIMSCEPEKDLDNPGEGEITFSLGSVIGEEQASRLSEISDVTSILVSIENSEGELIKDKAEYAITKFGEAYLSDPIALEVGNYNLTAFFVKNSSGEISYALPAEGSNLAELVADPAPMAFSIAKDEVNQINVEVISTTNYTPADFGYSSFAINFVETFDFQIAAFIYDEGLQNFTLTEADLTVIANGETVRTSSLNAVTELVKIGAGEGSYTVYVSKDGYGTFSQTITEEKLAGFYGVEGEPIVAVLNKGASGTLVLQPGSEGKDGLVFSHNSDPSVDRGTQPYFIAYQWTYNGVPVEKQSLIDFDLSALPNGATIKSAHLSLFYDSTSVDDGHSQLSGSNEAWLERITTSWEENVTWDTRPSTTDVNRVFLPASSSENQDYTDIDVTTLIQDMIDNPGESHGLLLKIASSDYYRSLTFASSDHENPGRHPKLVVVY